MAWAMTSSPTMFTTRSIFSSSTRVVVAPAAAPFAGADRGCDEAPSGGSASKVGASGGLVVVLSGAAATGAATSALAASIISALPASGAESVGHATRAGATASITRSQSSTTNSNTSSISVTDAL